eukprot:TRINITY_DN31058_c0_g1_i1.p1 TRINITY_DN31058_c0_g1~~TRINITY_DN31058_c0_g1_i1.p1  ORF type:complete len:301 (-),score=44.15 TRINITY_DN31058_c0_g1_i1:289-1191(-)
MSDSAEQSYMRSDLPAYGFERGINATNFSTAPCYVDELSTYVGNARKACDHRATLDAWLDSPAWVDQEAKKQNQSVGACDEGGVRSLKPEPFWWHLVWCFERVHKLECDPLRIKLSRAVKQARGRLLCFKTRRLFEAYVCKGSHIPFILLAGRRELKPCLDILSQHSPLRAQQATVVLGPLPQNCKEPLNIRSYPEINDADRFVDEVLSEYLSELPPPIILKAEAPPGLSGLSMAILKDRPCDPEYSALPDDVSKDAPPDGQVHSCRFMALAGALSVPVDCDSADRQDLFIDDVVLVDGD